jgi:hypothetical protein
MNERGVALITVLLLLLIITPLAAMAFLQAHTDWLLERNLLAEQEAFYVAEAGLEHAVGSIRPGTPVASLWTGPDGIEGTADDGVFAFEGGTPAPFPDPPLRYDVRVERRDRGVGLVSTGLGRHGTQKTVRGIVDQSPLPFTPGAVSAQADVLRFDLGGAGFRLLGLDHKLSDAPGSPSGSAPAVPGLSVATDSAAVALRRELGVEAAARVQGAGGTPSIAGGTTLDVDALVRAASQRGDVVALPMLQASEQVVLGDYVMPQVTVVSGDADISGTVDGTGILIVQGALRVSGNFRFNGLVVAGGDVAFGSTSTAAVRGALWHAAARDARVDFLGRGEVAYSSEALQLVDASFPTLLPHDVILLGWEEVL